MINRTVIANFGTTFQISTAAGTANVATVSICRRYIGRTAANWLLIALCRQQGSLGILNTHLLLVNGHAARTNYGRTSHWIDATVETLK